MANQLEHIPISETVPHAVALAERAALFYREAEACLPVTDASTRLLDDLFDLIAALESIASCDIGPLARDVLGARDPLV